MAIRLLNLGLASQPPDPFNVPPQDTLKIIFHQSGTFYCSEGCGNFAPPLPDNVFFPQGETWPDSGGAKPKATVTVQAKYRFVESPDPVPSERALSAADTGGPLADHVIHIP
jgi:hypothetical protein